MHTFIGTLDVFRQNNELASLPSAQRRWSKRLKLKFDMLAVSVKREDLDNYIAWCREQGLANGTVNRDLAALKRAFNLAFEAGKIARMPKFPKNLKELNRRKGFVEEQAYRKLAAHAQGWLRALLAVAYAFGFRKSELLNLRVRQVDLLHRIINLETFETKNDEARKAPMTDEVFLLLQTCVEGKRQEDFVFTRENGGAASGAFAKPGSPVLRSRVRSAGLPDLHSGRERRTEILHDGQR